MYYGFSPTYIVLTLVIKLAFGWQTELRCDPFLGVDIDPDDCAQALLLIHDIAVADTDGQPRVRLFARDGRDLGSKLPHGFEHGSCVIGVDLEGMSGLHITSTWSSFHSEAETLVEKCIKAHSPDRQRGFGGHYKLNGFTFVVANPAIVDTQGTPLATTDPPPLDTDLSTTLSRRAEAAVTAERDLITFYLDGNIQGGVATFSLNTFQGVLVRQQGPWLLSGGTWVPKPQWFFDPAILSSTSWLLYRSLRPRTKYFPRYYPAPYEGASIQPLGSQEQIPMGGLWLSEGAFWRPILGEKINILKTLSYQWEWVLVRGPGGLSR
ncbi:hypothetical protein MMC11_003699 [Xylographa trunciseda]|nr:hypothetical protein [Xylographa trunciseda]